ncbi:hypothetical protein KAR91_73610 [Candidatus Pacearchaeota archaeon]|nr:hypothetical protein [Candidatus Pacearchaeota archaeon]
MNKPPYEGKEFEALALRYEDHVELLRTLTQIDLRLTTALVTIQFVLCGFIATQTSISLAPRFGLIIVDIAVCSLVCRLLYLNYVRRREAVATLKNINCALGFLEKGIYLHDKAINPSKEEYAKHGVDFRPWLLWYFGAVVFCVLGLIVITFSIIPLSKSSPSISELTKSIGYTCTVHLRENSFDSNLKLPLPLAEDNIHTSNYLVTGKLIGFDNESIHIEEPSAKIEYWIPKKAILFIQMENKQ